MTMTDEQIERYSRHIILKEVGAKGQKKLPVVLELRQLCTLQQQELEQSEL